MTTNEVSREVRPVLPRTELSTATPVLEARAVQYALVDGIAVATLASPQSRNALSPELLGCLLDACHRAVADGAAALVVTSEGRTFCSGGDLAGVGEALAGDADRIIPELVDQLHEVITCLTALPMPVIAAVNGTAVGAGVAVALAADVRVVASSASFITGYLAVNASPDGGASFHLARALGGPQALSAFLLNRRLTAEELRANGLADRVVEDGEVLAVALTLAHSLATLSFSAVRAVRDLVASAGRNTLQQHLDLEKQHFVEVARTPEFRDAMAPFLRPSSP